MKKTAIFISLFFVLFIVSCGGSSTEQKEESTTETEEVNDDSNVEGDQLAQFEEVKIMLTASDIPTWDNGNQYFFFRADGTMGGGDASGEGSLYDGNWKLENGGFFWKKTGENWKSVKIETDGVDIFVDGVKYKKATY